MEDNTASNAGAQNLGGKVTTSVPGIKFLCREAKQLLYGKHGANIGILRLQQANLAWYVL